MASAHALCLGCDARIEREAGVTTAASCEQCGRAIEWIAPAGGAPVDRCAACGHAEMYVQKDFNRATGIALVVLGSIFVPWTWGLSLLLVTIVDWVLYYKLGDVTVCYACNAVHRGYPTNPDHKHFDLVIHDRHVYGAAPPGAEEGHG